MSTQACPRCKSNRIRQGYRATPILRKLIFRYNLLCNDCNWEFIGYAIPGTVSSKVKRRPRSNRQSEEHGRSDAPFQSPSFEPKSIISNIGESESDAVNGSKIETEDSAAAPSDVKDAVNPKTVKRIKVRKRVRIKLL